MNGILDGGKASYFFVCGRHYSEDQMMKCKMDV